MSSATARRSLRTILTDPGLPRADRLKYRLPLVAGAVLALAGTAVGTAAGFSEKSDGCETTVVTETGGAAQAALDAGEKLNLGKNLGVEIALRTASNRLEAQLAGNQEPPLTAGEQITTCVSHSPLGGWTAVSSRTEDLPPTPQS